jgi:hypothetical protein
MSLPSDGESAINQPKGQVMVNTPTTAILADGKQQNLFDSPALDTSNVGKSNRMNNIIYKYVAPEGALKIISNRTLRFGRPSTMNDPFDIYIYDLFNMNIREAHRLSSASQTALLKRDPVAFAEMTGTDPDRAAKVAGFLLSLSPEIRASVGRAVEDGLEADTHLTEILNSLEFERQGAIAQFKNSGIFCATRNHSNLLMWAHYADQHRVVVLGFRPDYERDSFLRLLEPVRYSDRPPLFYEESEKKIGKNYGFTATERKEIWRNFVLSKSKHWSYEEELRIVIPDEVPDGKDASFLEFYRHELCEVYLGCRMGLEFRDKIAAAARALNSEVAIFSARLAKNSYALTFESDVSPVTQ